MKIMQILALASVSALALSSAAFAADLLVTPEPALDTPSVDWTGMYIGAFGGSGWGTISPEGLSDEEADGNIAGLQVGYDWQMDMFVIGVQTEFTKSWMAWTDEDPPDTIDWLGSTTVRAGLALDRLMPYLKAGVAYGAGTGSAGGIEASGTGYGWTAGIGAEFQVTDNISIFAEYDHYHVGNASLDFSPGPVIDAEFDADIAKAGVNFKF